MKGGYFWSHPAGEALPTGYGFSRCALCSQHMWEWHTLAPRAKDTGQEDSVAFRKEWPGTEAA